MYNQDSKNILKISIHTTTFFLIGKLVLFCIAALFISRGRSNEMSRITPEIALFIVVKSREVLASLSMMLLVWLSDPGQPVGG